MTDSKWSGDIFFYGKDVTPCKGVLLLGPAKAGKTTFAASAPTPFFLDSDGGLTAVAGQSIPFTPIRLRMEKEEKARYQTPYRKLMAYLIWAKDATGPFAPDGPLADRRTIVVDSWSSFAHIEWIRLHEVMGVDLVAQGKVSQFDPCWQQLLNGLIYLNSLMRDIKESGRMNVVGVTHIQEKRRGEDIVGGEAELLGGFRNQINKYYDDILYVVRLGTKHYIHTEGATIDRVEYPGGHRTQGLQSRLESPTWEGLYGKGGN